VGVAVTGFASSRAAASRRRDSLDPRTFDPVSLSFRSDSVVKSRAF
jgi:hypothetical protein